MSSDATLANTVAIGPSRVRYGSLAALFGLLFIGVMARSLTAASALGVVIAVGLFGPLLVFALHRLLMRRPLIVIDHRGFTNGRSGRAIPWDAVDEIYANEHQGAFGVDHSLRLVLNRRPDHPVKRRFITTNARK